MQYIDVIRVNSRAEARAMRDYLNSTRESGIVIFSHRALGLVCVFADGSITPIDLDAICPGDSWEEINLTEQNVAWAGCAVNMGRLPEGSTVWTDDGRFKKVGGHWCRLRNRYYVCVSEADTVRFASKAWLR